MAPSPASLDGASLALSDGSESYADLLLTVMASSPPSLRLTKETSSPSLLGLRRYHNNKPAASPAKATAPQIPPAIVAMRAGGAASSDESCSSKPNNSAKVGSRKTSSKLLGIIDFVAVCILLLSAYTDVAVGKSFWSVTISPLAEISIGSTSSKEES